MLDRRALIAGTAPAVAGCAHSLPPAVDAAGAIAIARREATRHGWPPGEAQPSVEDREEMWAISYQAEVRTVTIVRKTNGELINFQVYQ